MRKLIYTLGSCIAFVIFLFAWLAWIGPEARAGKRNQQNSYRLQKGMTLQQAFAVMGPAQRVEVNTFYPQQVIYLYTSQPFASSEVAFNAGPDNTVTHISHGTD